MDNTIRIWDIESFSCMYTLTGHTESVNCLELLNEYTLASGSSDASVRIWNLNNFKFEVVLNGFKHAVDCIRLLSDTKFACGSQKSIRVSYAF